MAEKNENANLMTHDDGHSDEDNLSLGEWIWLDKMLCDNVEATANLQKRKMIHSKKYIDVEITREAIEVLENVSLSSETVEMHSNENNRTEHFTKNDENLDGQTVTTDNHTENDESRISTILNSSVDEIIKPIGTFANIIIACLLAALIGFSIGCIVSRGEAQLSGHEVDFKYAENVACRYPKNKSTKQTFRPDIDIGTSVVWEQPEEILEQISNKEQLMNVDENNPSNNDDSLQTILEKVKFSLDIFCSIIANKTHVSRESDEYDTICAKPLEIVNLIELKKKVQSFIIDIGFIEDRSNEWFMKNINLKLKDISISFVNDLSMTIRNSVVKIMRKFDKMKHKLDQRLCFMHNTLGDDLRFHQIFDKYKSSIKNCPTQKSDHEAEIETGTYKLEKKEQNMKKHIHTHDIGSKVKVSGLDNGSKKENLIRTEQDKSYKWKRDQKSQKKFSKGDFTSERGASESKKYKTEKINERFMVLPKSVENFENERDSEQICDTNSCARQQIDDKKKDSDPKYRNWQFQRSEERFNLRGEKKFLNEDDELSWNDKRAKARRSARNKY